MQVRYVEPIDGLTPRQVEVLRLIGSFCDSQRYSPTIAELASRMHISRSTVFEHLGELQRKGLLATSPGRAGMVCSIQFRTSKKRRDVGSLRTSSGSIQAGAGAAAGAGLPR